MEDQGYTVLEPSTAAARPTHDLTWWHGILPACHRFVRNTFMDERGKWSTARILLWAVTAYGMRLGEVEVSVVRAALRGVHGTFLPNTLWAAWSGTEMWLAVAVFGPRIGQYVSGWFSGGAAALASALRDKSIDPVTRRAVAEQLGAKGTEWTP